MFLQVGKHRRTVCTHQVRDCDFKDIGCQYKVSLIILIHISLVSFTVTSYLCKQGNFRDLSNNYKEQLVYHNQFVTKATRDLEKFVELKTVVMDQQVASIKSEVACNNFLSD